MTKNIVSVAAAFLGAGVLMTGCNLSQPEAGCIVQDGSFASWVAQYDLKEGETITSECQNTVLHGELLGVFKFTDPQTADSSILTLRPRGLSSRASLDPCDADTQAALRKQAQDAIDAEQDPAKKANLITAQSELNAELTAECGPPEAAHFAQTAYGHLSDTTGAKANTDKDFCSTSDWTAAKVNPRPADQVSPTVAPTTSIKYEFANVKVYSAPDAPGTQLSGDLTYTRDGCVAHYTVRAIWPATPCNPNSPKPADTCGDGSGINPDFAVQCDTSFRIDNTKDDAGNYKWPGTCVASKAIPSFKMAR